MCIYLETRATIVALGDQRATTEKKYGKNMEENQHEAASSLCYVFEHRAPATTMALLRLSQHQHMAGTHFHTLLYTHTDTHRQSSFIVEMENIHAHIHTLVCGFQLKREKRPPIVLNVLYYFKSAMIMKNYKQR